MIIIDMQLDVTLRGTVLGQHLCALAKSSAAILGAFLMIWMVHAIIGKKSAV